MWCSDPFQTELRRRGYCVVGLPRTSIVPLTLLLRDGDRFESIGPITDVLTPDPEIDVPDVDQGGTVADLGSLRTGALRAGLGLSVLAGIVKGLGGNADTLKLTYAKTRRLTLELQNIHEDSVPVVRVETYLAGSDLNPLSRHTSRLLHIGGIYLITSTLKSSLLEIEAEAKSSGELAVNAEALTAAGIQGQAAITATQGAITRVRYKGDEELVFAFKAIQLSYRNGQFERYRYVDPKAAKMGKADQSMPSQPAESEFLIPDTPMLDLF
jgi:hypothetical protein